MNEPLTAAAFAKLVNSYELHAPVTVADCREIFDDIKPRLAAGCCLDVMMRGLGSEHDPAPLFVEVVINAHTDHPSRERINVST